MLWFCCWSLCNSDESTANGELDLVVDHSLNEGADLIQSCVLFQLVDDEEHVLIAEGLTAEARE